MKVILTGVAGFVGSNLVKSLLSEGHSVIGIDNFSYGYKRNIEPYENNSQFQFIEGDVNNPDLFKSIKGDALVHLASQKIPRYTNAFKTLEDNNVMLKNVVNKCKHDKIKLVFASTSDVYGKNTELPFTENSSLVMGPPTVKRWAYAISKLYSEQYIFATSEEFGLEFAITRFFGSYGPNQNMTWWGGPQSVFIQNIIEGKPIELHGDGLQTRTFTYVEDTVQGVMKCIFHPASKNEVFNIANNPTEEITIKDLAYLIWDLMKGKGTAIDVKFIPYASFGNYEDVMRRVPCIEKIKTMLDYEPKFMMKEGLQKAIEWQIKNQE